jgi:hypothetical protein
MTLLVFLGVVVSLLILRLVPGLLLHIALAIPRRRLMTMRLMIMTRWLHARRIGFALSRNTANIPVYATPPARRLKLVLVSSSLLALAVLLTTAFWTWHSTALMMLLR